MAIIKDTELENGIKVDGAYLRVENITLDKTSISFNVRKYVDKTKSFFSEEYLTCSYDIEGENPFIQAYEYLKTLEEFKDSEDC